jgi:hypothetical protein
MATCELGSVVPGPISAIVTGTRSEGRLADTQLCVGTGSTGSTFGNDDVAERTPRIPSNEPRN